MGNRVKQPALRTRFCPAWLFAAATASSTIALCAAPAQAAWLELCSGVPSTEAHLLSQITQADGTVLSATVRDEPSGRDCPRLAIEAPLRDVLGLHPLTAATAADLAPQFSLSVRQEGQRLIFSDIAPGRFYATTPPADTLPLATNLLPRLQAAAFGAESRATVQNRGGQLNLQCRSGLLPAGARLSAPVHPPSARSRLQLTGASKGKFELLSSDGLQASTEDTSLLGVLAPSLAMSTQIWEFDNGVLGSTWRHWTIACPQEQGELTLQSLQLRPLSGPPPGRATWVWKSKEWQQTPDVVLKRTRRSGVKTLFITVPLAHGAVLKPERLQAFVQLAGAEGLSVWAVDGDPAMVLPGEHSAAATRARAYAVFNRQAPLMARLQGVQFDVEPYLLKGHGWSDAEMDGHYLALVRSLHQSLQDHVGPQQAVLALDMVVPFWWSGRSTLLANLAPLLSGLVVMDYRTNPENIYRFAVPFLDWGETHGKNVKIALEAGPISPENRQRYEQADTGVLWPVQLGGRHFLLMLQRPLPNPRGASFRLASSYVLDGSATTFHDDIPGLLKQLPALEKMFSAWPHFTGMALHELP
jgi:hypothetical protein